MTVNGSQVKSAMSLTPKQVEGLRHYPDKMVQRLVTTALKAMQRCDELAKDNERLAEEKTAEDLSKTPILILADHKGGIVVKAESYQPVKVIPIHEADSRNPDEEDDNARARTPQSHQHLWDCKTIARGNVGLDKYRRFWVDATVATIKATMETANGQSTQQGGGVRANDGATGLSQSKAPNTRGGGNESAAPLSQEQQS